MSEFLRDDIGKVNQFIQARTVARFVFEHCQGFVDPIHAAFSLMPYDLVTLEGPDGTAAQAFAETKNSLTYVVTGAYESGDVTMDGKVCLLYTSRCV